MQTLHVIGVDPGLSGAVAILPSERVEDIPTANVSGKRTYLPREMVGIVAPYKKGGMAVLEIQHAMPKQGRSSIFSIGTGYGIWLGIFAALDIPVHLVTAQKWKAEMLAGMGKEKEASRVRAQELFPGMLHLLKLKKDHNRAEALLIAEFGRRTLAL